MSTEIIKSINDLNPDILIDTAVANVKSHMFAYISEHSTTPTGRPRHGITGFCEDRGLPKKSLEPVFANERELSIYQLFKLGKAFGFELHDHHGGILTPIAMGTVKDYYKLPHTAIQMLLAHLYALE